MTCIAILVSITNLPGIEPTVSILLAKASKKQPNGRPLWQIGIGWRSRVRRRCLILCLRFSNNDSRKCGCFLMEIALSHRAKAKNSAPPWPAGPRLGFAEGSARSRAPDPRARHASLISARVQALLPASTSRGRQQQ